MITYKFQAFSLMFKTYYQLHPASIEANFWWSLPPWAPINLFYSMITVASQNLMLGTDQIALAAGLDWIGNNEVDLEKLWGDDPLLLFTVNHFSCSGIWAGLDSDSAINIVLYYRFENVMYVLVRNQQFFL